MTLLFAFLIGLFAGLRSLMPPAAVAWAVHLGWLRLVRPLGDGRGQARLHVRVRRAVHVGLHDVPRVVQGQARVRQRGGPVGVVAFDALAVISRRRRRVRMVRPTPETRQRGG